MGIRFSDLGLALHQDWVIDANNRHFGFLYLGEMESYLAVQPEPGFCGRAKSKVRRITEGIQDGTQ